MFINFVSDWCPADQFKKGCYKCNCNKSGFGYSCCSGYVSQKHEEFRPIVILAYENDDTPFSGFHVVDLFLFITYTLPTLPSIVTYKVSIKNLVNDRSIDCI